MSAAVMEGVLLVTFGLIATFGPVYYAILSVHVRRDRARAVAAAEWARAARQADNIEFEALIDRTMETARQADERYSLLFTEHEDLKRRHEDLKRRCTTFV
jgi:hypothetical protein